MEQNQNQQEIQEQVNTTIVYVLVEYLEERVISAAIFNNMKRTLELCSFLDNQHYVNLQSFLIQVNPKEKQVIFRIICQLPQLNSQRKKILSKFQDLDMNLKQNKTVNTSQIIAVIQPKLKFLLQQDIKLFEKQKQNKKALVALDCLLNQLQLERQKTNKHQFTLKLFENQSYMKLDKACLNALNIFSKDMEKKIIAGNSNLYDILNRCKTSFGTRCLKRWMKQPLQNKKQLQKRLDILTYFSQNQGIKNIIQNELKKLPDLQKIYFVFYKVQSGKKCRCEISDLIKLHKVITCVQDLVKNIQNKGLNDQIIEEIYKCLQSDLKVIAKLAGMIQKCIDMSSQNSSQYIVRAQTQPNLSAIKRSMDDIRRNIKQQQAQVQRYLRTQADVIQSATYRYVFECLKKGYVQKVKEADDYKFLTAKQIKITFTTNNLIRLCNNLIAFQEQYKNQQQQVLNKMFKIVAGYYPVMERLSSTLAQLDILIGWANIVSTSAANERWSKPSFTQNLRGYQMRHPCVKNCIPNDINISKKKTAILTGPNMGGKSTYIRTIGVCCYLAHLGMYVPALNFECPIIDAIICRVGASDQQVKGISTFMGEMIQTSCMLKTSTNKSLVLIDELGRGTSTNEGFGLSWSLCKYLHTKINPYCLFATHFHQMIQIQEEVDGITNMYTACKMNNKDELQFQYRVYEGKIQKSYGIQVAKMLNFPKQIIEDAQNYLQIYENKGDNKLYDLNPEQETQVSNLWQQMNKALQSSVDKNQSKKIKEQYSQRIKNYLKL